MRPAGAPLGAVQAWLPGSPVVGQVAPGLQLVHLGKLDGWWDPTASTGTTTQKPNEHGAYLGPAFYTPRVVQLDARIDGFTPKDSMALARQLINSLTLSTLVDLSVTDEEGTLTAAVRQEGDPLLARQGNRVIVSLSMLAPDPRRYGPWQRINTTWHEADVVNDGDIESLPTFTLQGPVVAGATITDQGGRRLYIVDAVPVGSVLVVDSAARTALLNGVTNKTVTGTWPELHPGANRFVVSSGSRLIIDYRSASR